MRRVIGTDELKDFEDDAFRLIPSKDAGFAFFVLVVVFIVIEPLFR